ncbi:MAG: c-type cytochrome domain-containing protein, partial [Rubripirellula sp.]
MKLKISTQTTGLLTLWICLSPIFSLDAARGNESDTSDPVATEAGHVTDFLNRYCVECHNAETSEGERRFDQLPFPFTNVDAVIRADEIIDQLTLRSMPPEDSEQPSDEDRLRLIGTLRNEVKNAKSLLDGSTEQTVMRRLSNREYENTLRALFGRLVDTLGLTLDFPKENTSHHID